MDREQRVMVVHKDSWVVDVLSSRLGSVDYAVEGFVSGVSAIIELMDGYTCDAVVLSTSFGDVPYDAMRGFVENYLPEVPLITTGIFSVFHPYRDITAPETTLFWKGEEMELYPHLSMIVATIDQLLRPEEELLVA